MGKNEIYLLLITILFCSKPWQVKSQEKPNILWITCEDISPYLGCYGFDQAHTPNLDSLAKQGIRFTNA